MTHFQPRAQQKRFGRGKPADRAIFQKTCLRIRNSRRLDVTLVVLRNSLRELSKCRS